MYQYVSNQYGLPSGSSNKHLNTGSTGSNHAMSLSLFSKETLTVGFVFIEGRSRWIKNRIHMDKL